MSPATAPSPIYLDYAASAPPAPEVVEAMLAWMGSAHANPHAGHLPGRRAALVVEAAREAIAALIDADAEGVILTSGATEANNLAIKGFMAGRRRQLYLSSAEHKSLIEPARACQIDQAVRLHMLAPDVHGLLSDDCLTQAMQRTSDPDATPFLLVSHGNNELGTLQDLAQLAHLAHAHGGFIHVDASQTAGHLPISVADNELDLVCVSSHKMYGPAGIGALYVHPDLLRELTPQMHGGGQQAGHRSGTVPAFLAAGFLEAANLARRQGAMYAEHLRAISAVFLARLSETRIAFALVGDGSKRIPGHVSIKLTDVAADDVLDRLIPVLAASTGAACAAGEIRASHALRAIGLTEDDAGRVIRISFGRSSTADEARGAADAVSGAIKALRTQ